MSIEKQFTLSQIQNWMQSTLMRQDAGVEPENLVKESSRLTAARHLNIYRQSYIARLRECMKNQFSALAYALGEDLFQMFADQFLDAYPSASYTLNELGAKFPDYLEQTRPDAGLEEKEDWIDFIIELARFEYALSEIFDAHAEEPKAADEATPDKALKIRPVFRLFQHRHPVCKYYLDVVKKREPELPFEEESFCAVTRSDYRLSLLELKRGQYYFLERLSKGDSIAETKKYFVNLHNLYPTKMDAMWQEWRKQFLAAGFFARVD
jgi:hypothetical protein